MCRMPKGKLGSHYTHNVTLAFYFPCRAIALVKTQAIYRLAPVAWAGTVRPVRSV
jgi:hypothetical protein